MDLLKEAIASKKKELSSLKKEPNKKWYRKGEIEEERAKRYLEEMERERREKEERKRKREEEERQHAKRSKKTEETVDDFEKKPVAVVNKAEAIRLLREMGEPITLFGETDEQRTERLYKLQLARGEKKQHIGQMNEFALTLKEEEEKLLKMKYEQSINQPKKIEQRCEQLPLAKDDQVKEEYIRTIIGMLLKEWEIELEQRPDDVKNSSQGKMDSGTYKQTRKYVKPLMKKLKTRTLQSDVLNSLYQICAALAEREYVKANHEYLQLAIGNAPWPMGVTMVGIHERSAREKIANNKIAHILNDEQTRKYIQSVKRLMTFCQKRYPTDPSRMVV